MIGGERIAEFVDAEYNCSTVKASNLQGFHFWSFFIASVMTRHENSFPVKYAHIESRGEGIGLNVRCIFYVVAVVGYNPHKRIEGYQGKKILLFLAVCGIFWSNIRPLKGFGH